MNLIDLMKEKLKLKEEILDENVFELKSINNSTSNFDINPIKLINRNIIKDLSFSTIKMNIGESMNEVSDFSSDNNFPRLKSNNSVKSHVVNANLNLINKNLKDKFFESLDLKYREKN